MHAKDVRIASACVEDKGQPFSRKETTDLLTLHTNIIMPSVVAKFAKCTESIIQTMGQRNN